MPGPVRLTIASHEPQAELLCGLLRENGIQCVHRITNYAFGAGGEMPSSGAGPREVLVRPEDLERARSVLRDQLAAGAEADEGDPTR